MIGTIPIQNNVTDTEYNIWIYGEQTARCQTDYFVEVGKTFVSSLGPVIVKLGK